MYLPMIIPESQLTQISLNNLNNFLKYFQAHCYLFYIFSYYVFGYVYNINGSYFIHSQICCNKFSHSKAHCKKKIVYKE